MYCPTCNCDLAGWTGKCPVDGTWLVERVSISDRTVRTAPYETIVELLSKNGGVREIELQTTAVARRKKTTFPFRGYGFAWAERMQGKLDQIAVDLHIEEVGLKKEWGFPYQGYGFAWERQLRGWIGGHEIILTATKVAQEKKYLFPYRGHGYAWTEELSGTCGKSIKAELRTTEVGRDRKWFLFYFMFGYAWIKRATLKLSLVDPPGSGG